MLEVEVETHADGEWAVVCHNGYYIAVPIHLFVSYAACSCLRVYYHVALFYGGD